ncbi:nicotinamidase-related amidase [Actinoplanes octamycinicus]|uniref:Nicotinamidase-related amidase n=1 Tax=Actinoplanes octamycinicus TaxID=135948 RepID=A0A7W7M8K8_9ACTN|nr:isochorismatase family protein [Actinoplanes octamycinicus]MBB4740910.1 nicotinamidase-related amidase [Actinoplanes octamycinicus]GIE55817.1 isochorismatase [Actinoplanes octamycinicus]
MTTLSDRPGTALLVIDVQRGVLEDAFNRDAVIANIAALVERARFEQVPVVWVQHSDEENLPLHSPQWEYVAELPQADGEPVVHKKYGDAFEATDLEERLAERRVGRLVVTGASSDACIRSTIHGAFTRGYDVTLVSDAHTTGDLSKWGAPSPELVVAHTNLYWDYTSAPGRTAGTAPTAGVSFAAG